MELNFSKRCSNILKHFTKSLNLKNKMNWTKITSENELEAIKEASHQQKIIIFKHSTRCPTSSMALGRLERNWEAENDTIKPHFLDLIAYRSLSNKISEDFGIMHQSPQVLLIDKGECIYNASHLEINYQTLLQQ